MIQRPSRRAKKKEEKLIKEEGVEK